MASENALQKQKRESEVGLANAPLKKKISFFSAIIIVIGSVMGAGMFFKAGSVLKSSQGSILFSIFCWLIAVVAVILMTLALIEIASARNDNLSIIGWCQTFNSRVIYKACKNFMAYIYIPLSYFFLPLYFIMSIQDGVAALSGGTAYIGGQGYDWIITIVIVMATSVYFTVACGLSSRLGNLQNWVITAFNFVPVFIAVIVGAIGISHIGGVAGGQAGVNAGIISAEDIGYDFLKFVPTSGGTTAMFQTLTPGFGLFIAIGAIFFAYDGFYVTAGIQTEMKEPKKTPYALVYGLLAITVVYVTVAVVMSFASTDGSPYGMAWIFMTSLAKDGQGKIFDLGVNGNGWGKGLFLNMNNPITLYAAFQILIGVGVLSIINAFGMWTPRFVEDLIKANELPLSTKYINKLDSTRPKVGIMYNLIVSIPVIIIFCAIGALGYVNSGGYNVTGYGDALTRLYSFGDLMATWCSVGAFTFILFPIIGALRNRKLHFVHTEQNKMLVPSAIICTMIMAPAIFLTYFVAIADLFMLFNVPASEPGYVTDYLVPRIMLVVVLILYLIGTFVPQWIEDGYMKKKFGSVELGEGHKLEAVAEATDQSLSTVIFENLKTTKRFSLNKWEQGVLKKDKLSEKEIQEIIATNY